MFSALQSPALTTPADAFLSGAWPVESISFENVITNLFAEIAPATKPEQNIGAQTPEPKHKEGQHKANNGSQNDPQPQPQTAAPYIIVPVPSEPLPIRKLVQSEDVASGNAKITSTQHFEPVETLDAEMPIRHSAATLNQELENNREIDSEATTAVVPLQPDAANALQSAVSTSGFAKTTSLPGPTKSDALSAQDYSRTVQHQLEQLSSSQARRADQTPETQSFSEQLQITQSKFNAPQLQIVPLVSGSAVNDIFSLLPAIPDSDKLPQNQSSQALVPNTQINLAPLPETNVVVPEIMQIQGSPLMATNLNVSVHAENTKVNGKRLTTPQLQIDKNISKQDAGYVRSGVTDSKPIDRMQHPDVFSQQISNQAATNNSPTPKLNSASRNFQLRETTAPATYLKDSKLEQKPDQITLQAAGSIAGQPVPSATPANVSQVSGSAVNIPATANMPVAAVPGTATSTLKSDLRDVQPTAITATPMQVHSAHIVQSDNRAAMRLDMRTQSFGGVEIHTTVLGKDVQLAVSAEHGDLRAFLVPELPALQNSLQQHDLRLEQAHAQINTGTQSEFSSGSGRQEQRFTRQRPQAGTFYQPEELPGKQISEDSRTGLSIRI